MTNLEQLWGDAGCCPRPWECGMSPTKSKPLCGFCKGEPVYSAASWLDDKPRPPLPCPRCGETNYPKDSK